MDPLEIKGDEGPLFEEELGMEPVLGVFVIEFFSKSCFGKEGEEFLFFVFEF